MAINNHGIIEITMDEWDHCNNIGRGSHPSMTTVQTYGIGLVKERTPTYEQGRWSNKKKKKKISGKILQNFVALSNNFLVFKNLLTGVSSTEIVAQPSSLCY